MIYIMSDDDFFSLGVWSVFNNSGEYISILPFSLDSWQRQFDMLNNNDILLLAVEFMDLTGQMYQYLSMKDIRVCLFINNAHGYEYFTGHHGIVSRRIPASMIIEAVCRAVKKNALSRITDKLTPSERLVMDYLSNGVSVSRIAEFLNVTEKTVYNHKKQAIHRMGINKLRNKAILIYGCINLNASETLIGA